MSESPDPGSRARELAQSVYEELRDIAAGYLARERRNHTLQATALVNEAWARMAGQELENVRDEGHFRALSAQAMRRILIDHARASQAAKREKGGGEPITLSGIEGPDGDGPDSDVDVLVLDAALVKLAEVSPRQARVVELRFFGGLSIDEVADVVGVSARTVDGDWRVARAWLARELAL